jgi:ElaB/YqjD/DUF883 family membrane-anchored ribosome-binding protein
MAEGEVAGASAKSKGTVEAEIAELRERLERLINERGEPLLRQAAKRADDAAHAARSAAEGKAESLAANIRQAPFAAVGIAAAIGLLIGMMIRR